MVNIPSIIKHPIAKVLVYNFFGWSFFRFILKVNKVLVCIGNKQLYFAHQPSATLKLLTRLL